MTLPIMIGDLPIAPVRCTPPVCIACSEGDHELALRLDEWCNCPCHGKVPNNG